MNRSVIFFCCALFFCFVIEEVSSNKCELKARINKAFQELPIVEEMKHHSRKGLTNSLHGARSIQTKRTNRESIPQLAKNIESFLQKVIPNHNLVQDLMGYITMPNPNSLTDMNICPDSTPSESEETTDSCQCPPEYYCAYICGEDYSQISTPISWQHFPRSTSSRSRCDDSSPEISKTPVSESTVVVPAEEEKKSRRSSSESEYPIVSLEFRISAYLSWQNCSQRTFEVSVTTTRPSVQVILASHSKIPLQTVIGNLVAGIDCSRALKAPCSVLTYVETHYLLDKCLKYRDAFGEPPLLFTHNHLKSLYTAFDPFERGYLTLDQYEEAMRSLALENNITSYNKEPTLNDGGFVEQSFFVAEVERCLTENLKKMLRIPRIWEENRLLWKKRMQKKASRAPEAASEFDEESKKEDQKEEGTYCKCANLTKSIFCHCGRISEIKCELEQLYLE